MAPVIGRMTTATPSTNRTFVATPVCAMTAEEVNALADFLIANVLGKTRITRDNCAAFNAGNRNAPECQQF